MNERPEIDELIQLAAAGNAEATNDLFGKFHARLSRMIQLRMNPQLRGRLDEADILQETYLTAAKGLHDYLAEPPLPFYLWLRHVAEQKLIDAHRRHLGAQARDAAREVSLHQRGMSAATSADLAAKLLGKLTSPSQALAKSELRQQIQDALDGLDPVDREVLVLRHFEQLDTAEVAAIFGIGRSGASSRYVRALRRLKAIVADKLE